MAGNLKASELRSVLRRLDSANRALETCVQSLGECQKTLQKSIQCQSYLNHSCVKSACHESSALIIEGGRCASFDHLEEIKISQLHKLQVTCKSIQPIRAGFVPNENARTVPGHAAV